MRSFCRKEMIMGYSIKTTKDDVDYNAVNDILKSYGMSNDDVEIRKKIFLNSYAVSFSVAQGHFLTDTLKRPCITLHLQKNITVKDSDEC